MSDIPRYKPVPDDRFGIADDADGKLCEYRHYEQLKSTVQSFAANVLRLGNEVRDLTKERDGLQEHIKYLEIELKCETGRWERTMEDNARLKAEVERLYRHGDLMLKFAAANMTYPAYATYAKDWLAVKESRKP